MNSIVLVGKIKESPVIVETASSYKKAQLVMEVRRNFRNSEGNWESDLFLVTLWRGIAEEILACGHVGDLISVKGRLQANNFTKNDGTVRYNTELIAEHVSILNNLIK